MALLEAAAVGLLVVSTAVGGVPEVRRGAGRGVPRALRGEARPGAACIEGERERGGGGGIPSSPHQSFLPVC